MDRQIPAKAHESARENDHRQRRDQKYRLLKGVRNQLDKNIETEVTAQPDGYGRADEHEPHEAGPGDLVIPDEGSREHVTGEHAEQKIDRNNSKQHDASPFQALVQK